MRNHAHAPAPTLVARRPRALEPGLVALALLMAPALASAEVTIDDPAAGARVEATFTVSVTYSEIEVCTGTCYMITPSSVALSVDGSDIASCNTTSECSGGAASFEVTLEPGPHTLVARSFGDLSGESSTEVMVEVMAEEDDDAGGCTCRSDRGSSGSSWMALGLLALGVVRASRRRRDG
ncbi:MAG: MYXO-CTERM sorting domain-containing protein [Nannocystaceae bacterium]